MRFGGSVTHPMDAEARRRFLEWLRRECDLLPIIEVLEDRIWMDPSLLNPRVGWRLSPDDVAAAKAAAIRRIRDYPDGVARLSRMTCRVVDGKLKLELPG